jgi:microcystin-dependent protein
MTMTKYVSARFARASIVACTLAAALVIYVAVPPPPPARAFEAQSTWGGTGGGSANAQTVPIANVQSLNDVLGVPLRYVPANDNTGPSTISINGLTATAVRRPSNIGLVALSGGELQAGVTTTIMYNGSTIEIQGPVDMSPIGRTVEFRGSVTPRGTLIEDGSCVSRTTFAPLFSVIGTNYGACDGTTTFGVPTSKGRSFVALDTQGSGGAANVITTAGSGCDATAVGNCGAQNHTLTIPELPVITPTAGFNFRMQGAYPSAGAGVAPDTFMPGANNTALGAATSPSFGSITIAPFGSGNAHSILNPISLGRRAIKY